MARNARKQKSTRRLDKVSEDEPQSAKSELERRVIQLEKDVSILKQLVRWPIFNRDAPIDKTTKPGVKEKIKDEVLFNYRDGLTLWLEAFWPWLEDRLYRASSAEEVGAILEAVSEEPELRRNWQKRLLPHPAELFDFISDNRFRRAKLPKATVKDALTLPVNDDRRRRTANQFPARQIANAMAGVPDIGWRRSLDRCSANPSTTYLVLNTDLYYREIYGLPLPDAHKLTGAYSPVPKPLQPVLARPNGGTNMPETEPKHLGTMILRCFSFPFAHQKAIAKVWITCVLAIFRQISEFNCAGLTFFILLNVALSDHED